MRRRLGSASNTRGVSPSADATNAGGGGVPGKENRGHGRADLMAPQPAAAMPLRVLIVEDDRNVATMFINVLSHVGIQNTHSVSTTVEAMALIGGDEPIDIAFVDINLDVIRGGVDVAKAAAARNLYVIIVTGDDRVPDDLAGHALLLKPFSVDQLETIVNEARRHFRR
jgi:DNA-binding NtrC family response regulator